MMARFPRVLADTYSVNQLANRLDCGINKPVHQVARFSRPPYGFVASVARPGGNITSFATYEQSISVKWLELLKEIAPRVTRVAFMYDPANPISPGYLREIEAAAPSLGMKILPQAVHNSAEIER
jgi:putative tryptophan/tyrosine transport system substrate-binding protein